MKGKTLTEIYNEKKKLPTPAAKFIAELCELTHRSKITVILWVRGKVRPDINTQRVIAMHLKTDVETLFPSKLSSYGNR